MITMKLQAAELTTVAIRQQFIAVAKKQHPRSSIRRKANRQQLTNLERSITRIAALIACSVSILATKRIECNKLIVLS